VAQYPYLLPPALTIADAAVARATLVATLVSLVVGALILVPSLGYLYTLFQRAPSDDAPPDGAVSAPPRVR
jgi:cytochrome d ubiquinol oxidase subunit II